MKKYVGLILALIVWALIHEGIHALVASFYDEYKAFLVHPYGLEVVFQTPVAEREGIKWGLISGVSNVATILLGYLALSFRVKIARSQGYFLKRAGYYLTMFSLLLDPLNLSVGPFIYGGDINGISVGFGINS